VWQFKKRHRVKLFLFTLLAMTAFAANSLLNRAALSAGDIGPAGFAALRVVAGAVVLFLLLWGKSRGGPTLLRPDIPAVVSLTTYLLSFSFAYVALDAGLGALVLFAGVQITLFAGGLREGDPIPLQSWTGMVLSLAGLAYLVWPSDAQVMAARPLSLMALAALGWGIYSLIGRRSSEPIAATARNYVYSVPLVLIVALPFMPAEPFATRGVLLALISGAITSGLGYALWYRVLPQLEATTGALAQLTVPVIALVAGAVILAEPITARAVLACALILGGIALGLSGKRT
jgi:drug/metabolite transporter (DMT)-like permease